MRRLVFEPPCASRSSFSSSSSSPPSWVAAPAGAAEYTVVTCNGQAGGRRRLGALRQAGPTPRWSENCAAAGGSIAAVLGRQPGPCRVERGLAGRRPRRHHRRRRHALRKVAVAGTRYGYAARALTPTAASTRCSRTAPTGRLQTGDRPRLVRVALGPRRRQPPRGRRPVRARRARSRRRRGRRGANLPRRHRVHRQPLPTISRRPLKPDVQPGEAVSGVQSIAATFKDSGGGIASTGIEVDGQTVERRPCPTPAVARLTGGSCRAR